jgi:uncharacterized membrane protein YphA (DoxX/SURF4 family)
MPYLVMGIRCLLGVVFLISSTSKVRAPRAFVASVGDLRVLPASLVRPVAVAVIAAELAICLLCAVPGGEPAVAGFLTAAGLLTAFSVGIVASVRRDVRTACRCFGAGTVPLGMRHVARNMALAAVAVLGATAAAWPGPVRFAGTITALLIGLVLAGAVVGFDRIVDLVYPRRTAGSDTDGERGRPSVTVGERVGAFATVSVDGAPLTSDTMLGETLVGFFSPRCRICALRLPKFVEYARGMPGGRGQVLAVVISDTTNAAHTTDTTAHTADLVAELSAVARVVTEDRHGVLKAAFQVQGYPTMLVVAPDSDGRLVVRTDRPLLDSPPAAAD